MAGPGQTPGLELEKFLADHLTKFVVNFEDSFTIKSWMIVLMQNIRNPHDTANSLFPGSMKKVWCP